MHILYAPVHHVFSDKIGSEYYVASRLVIELLKRSMTIRATAICGYYLPSEKLRQELQNTLYDKMRIIPLYRGEPSFSDVHKLKFYINLYFYVKSHRLVEKADIIHHVLPFRYKLTFNLLYKLAGKYKKPFIIGPLQSPQLIVGRDEHEGQMFVERSLLQNLNMLIRIASPILLTLFKNTLKEARILVATTKFAQRLYEKYADEDKIVVIPFGIDANSVRVKDYNYGRGKVSIMYAGLLIYRKGVHYLLKAFAEIAKRYKNVELHIYGSGPQEYYLKELALSLGIPGKVKFHGLIPRERLLKEYSKHDIYAHPSLSESFGLAILEAMASGLPVVAFNIPNVNEIVEHGKVGLLARQRDPNDLSRKLALLIEDEKLRKTLGSNARKRVEEVYDWSIISQKYINIYKSLIS